jgi:exodeoxyribonuclease VII large subunit
MRSPPISVSSVPPAGEEQRFDFAELADDDHRSARRHETAEDLVARVEKVHAVASRVRNRHRQVEDAADAYLSAFPLDDVAPGDDDPAQPTADDAPARPLAAVPSSPVTAESPPADVAAEVADADGELEPTLTIAAFYDRVRRALAAEFGEEVWVTGEIRGFRESRGHRFLELADVGAESSGGRGGAQQLEVVCWAREWPPIGRQLQEAGVELEVGRVVRVRGRVSVWEGASKLRFTLTALDVEALVGGIAAARRRLLRTLEAEGLLDRNRQRPVPAVPLRIGVVTSPGSEAHRDFTGQLERSGFAFEIHLEPSLVQGPGAPGQLVEAIARMAQFAPDICVIVRGGGARGDLAAFDSEEVARAIALAPFPVWSGIGHTGDRSVADEVVHTVSITPTACGEAVVAKVSAFWTEIERRARTIAGAVRAQLRARTDRLGTVESGLSRSARYQLDHRHAELAGARTAVGRAATSLLRSEHERARWRDRELRRGAPRAIDGAAADLDRTVQVLRAYDPRRQFERGWSLTHRDGVLVRSIGDLAAGDVIVTRFADGEASSTVETVPTGTETQGVNEERKQ